MIRKGRSPQEMPNSLIVVILYVWYFFFKFVYLFQRFLHNAITKLNYYFILVFFIFLHFFFLFFSCNPLDSIFFTNLFYFSIMVKTRNQRKPEYLISFYTKENIVGSKSFHSFILGKKKDLVKYLKDYIDVILSNPHMTWHVLVLKDVPPLRKLELV